MTVIYWLQYFMGFLKSKRILKNTGHYLYVHSFMGINGLAAVQKVNETFC